LQRFADDRSHFDIPSLKLGAISNFLALAPNAPCGELADLAADCVRSFDSFRVPPSAADMERRQPSRLTERQRKLLELWGYPYVMEEFRFHLTLTGRIESARQREQITDILHKMTRHVVDQPVPVDALTLFHQPSRDEYFRIIGRYPFMG
jgi:hypothetical protein